MATTDWRTGPLGCVVSAAFFGTLFALVALVTELSRDGFHDAAATGGELLLLPTETQTSSVGGRFRCQQARSVAFTPSWDTTQSWPFTCKNNDWSDKVSVSYGTGRASPITIEGRLLVPQNARLGATRGVLHGSVLAPVYVGRSQFTTQSLQLALALEFNVVRPEALASRRRARILRTLLVIVAGVLIVVPGGWAMSRLEARSSVA